MALIFRTVTSDSMEIRMYGRRILVMVPVLAAGLLGGCNDTAKMNEQDLLAENRGLRDQLTSARSAQDEAESRSRQLEYELGEARQKLADAEAQPVLPDDGAGYDWRMEDGYAVVAIEGDVLFDSGKHDLKPAAKKALAQIASVVKSDYPGSEIRINGFTDTDRIKTKKYVSNYHLGFERAYAVGQYLMSQGIPRQDISYGSFGPLKQLGTKAESRRVEVTVVPE